MTVLAHRAGQRGRVLIWAQGEPVQRELQWGLRPFEPGGRSYSLLRSEGRQSVNPCLIIAEEFAGKADSGGTYRARLVTQAPAMFMAGTWQPATDDWPAAYAALTVEAYPDLAPYKDRHIAVIREAHLYDWLQSLRPFEDMLEPFPAGSFSVTASRRPARADLFA